MINKNLNGNVIPKHGVEGAWVLEEDYIPEIAENIVYDPDKRHNYPRLKIGDGRTRVTDLPFCSEMNIDNSSHNTLEVYARRPISYWDAAERFEDYALESIGEYHSLDWSNDKAVGITVRENKYFPPDGEDKLIIQQPVKQRAHRRLLHLIKLQDKEQRFQFKCVGEPLNQGNLVFSLDINFVRLRGEYVNRGISFDIAHTLGNPVPTASPWGMVFDLLNEAKGVYYLDLHGYKLYLAENLWYNIRIEYSDIASKHPGVSVFVNNELVRTCLGERPLVDNRNRTVSSVDVFVGGTYKWYKAFLGEIMFDNVYLGPPINKTINERQDCTYPVLVRPENSTTDNIVLRSKDGTMYTREQFTDNDERTVVVSKGYVDDLFSSLQQAIQLLTAEHDNTEE